MSTNPMTLEQLGVHVRALADARAALGTVVTSLNQAIEQLKEERMPELKARIDDAAAAWSILERTIEANPHLFVKPRKVSLHGIQFGLEKGKGKVMIPNPERTIKLIKAKLPALADLLIAKKETPVKKAIEKLTATELKSIGCELGSTDDAVVIRPDDGAVDNLVKALIKASIDDEQDQPE